MFAPDTRAPVESVTEPVISPSGPCAQLKTVSTDTKAIVALTLNDMEPPGGLRRTTNLGRNPILGSRTRFSIYQPPFRPEAFGRHLGVHSPVCGALFRLPSERLPPIAARRYLLTSLSDVDPHRIGVIGHSLGGH